MSEAKTDPFAGLRSASPPEELRQRALAASLPALAAAPRPDLWWRLASNGSLRLAWVASVALLVVLNLVLPGPTGPRSPAPAMPVLIASASQAGELAEITDLPRIKADLPVLVGREAPSNSKKGHTS